MDLGSIVALGECFPPQPRSRPIYYSDELGGRGGNLVDRTAPRRIRQTWMTDENQHLAKVRVAGSNPVFRSQEVSVRAVSRLAPGPRGSTNLLSRSTTTSPAVTPRRSKAKAPKLLLHRGSGGVLQLADGQRVDIELPRDAVTGRRRRVSRIVRGSCGPQPRRRGRPGSSSPVRTRCGDRL